MNSKLTHQSWLLKSIALFVVALSTIFVAQNVFAQTGEGIANKNIDKFESWDRDKTDWITGQNDSYMEGETIPMRVQFKNLSANTAYYFYFCLDIDNTPPWAFTMAEPWNTTLQPPAPPSQGSLTSPDEGVQAENAKVSGFAVSYAGIDAGSCSSGSRPQLSYLVEFTALAGDPFFVIGGHVAAPGDVDEEGGTVGAGQGASSVNGTFQARTASVGDKTLNFMADPAANLRISIDPQTAANAVGDEHTFTIKVEQTVDGSNWTPVVGANPTVSVSPTPNSVTDNCASTNAQGQCTYVINSNSAGIFTASASVTVNVGGTSITRTTGTAANGAAGGTGNATKNYVNLRISINPPSAVNGVEEEHTFTVKVEDNTGAGWVAVQGVKPVVTFDVAPDSVTDNCSSSGTSAAGECTVVINNADAETFVASAEITHSVSDVAITRETGTQANLDAGGSEDATKTYQSEINEYRISIGPPAETNEVGDPHTFTVTVERNTGQGWLPVSQEFPTVIFNPNTTPTANTCPSGTDANGQCTVTINSTTPGVFSASASLEIGDFGTVTTGTSENMALGGSDDATKTYVDLRISIDPPQATNIAGDPHVFTVTVEQNDGTGWQPVASINPGVTVSPSPTSKTDDCADFGTGAGGTCEVTINSPTPGVFSASASVTTSVSGVEITRSTDDDQANLDAGGSGNAAKTYMDLRISIDPLSATNEINDPHTFTIKVEQNDGSGWVNVSGATPAVTFDPTITPSSDTCADPGTNGSGQCTVTINSATPGTFVASASVTVLVGDEDEGIEITRETGTAANSAAGGSDDATKTYEEPRGRLRIVKDADPADGTDFDFAITGIDGATIIIGDAEYATHGFTLDDADPDDNDTVGNSATFSTLGDYNVVESIPEGWRLEEIECEYAEREPSVAAAGVQGDGPIYTPNVENGELLVTVEPRDDIICTFENIEADVEIKFVKVVANGPATPDQWTFDVVETQATDIPHMGTANLEPGEYTVTESGPEGYIAIDAEGACSLEDGEIVLTVPESPVCASGLGCLQEQPSEPDQFTCQVTNTLPQIILTPSYLVTSVEEGKLTGHGSIACYWITLSDQPNGNVVIDVDPNGLLKEVKITPKQITLNAGNWNSLTTAETSNFLCVRPVDDMIDEQETVECGDKSANMTSDSGAPYAEQECGDHKEFVEHTVNAATTAPGYNQSTPWTNETLTFLGRPGENYLEALIRDNDKAGVILTESFAVSDLDEDGTPTGLACYWVTLKSKPVAGETVTVSASANGNINVQPATVELSNLNWDALGSQSNKVCITPVDNDTIDTTGAYEAYKNTNIYGDGLNDVKVFGDYLAFVNHTVTSTQSASKYFNNGAPFQKNGPELGGSNLQSQIDVLVREDDQAGTIFDSNQFNVVEGDSLSLQTRLASRPQNTVFVDLNISNSPVSVSAAGINGFTLSEAASLAFTPDNWNVVQTVTLTVDDNESADGTRTLRVGQTTRSTDANFDGLTMDDVATVTVVDNESAGVVVLTNAVSVAEGDSGVPYALVLTSQPSGPVTVNIVTDDQSVADRRSVVFNQDNWKQPQQIIVSAVDDEIDDDSGNGQIDHLVSSSDAGYDGMVAGSVKVWISDNDSAGVAVGMPQRTSLDEGVTTSYTLRLRSQPIEPVTLLVATDGRTTASPAAVTFNAGNWNTPQSVLLTAVDDNIDSLIDARETHIDHGVVSADGNYSGIDVESVGVTITDNDTAAVVLSKQTVSMLRGEQATYTVRLASQPLSDVLLTFATSNKVKVDGLCDAGEEASACVQFTAADWNVEQTITVTGLIDGQGLITHAAVSSDTKYDGINVASVDVNVNDNPNDHDVFLPMIARR